MRILHLDSGREMRGGQWQVLRLVEGLAAQGVENTLLARPGAPLFERARKLVRVEPLTWTRVLALGRTHDLVHAHDARGHTLGLLARPPLVVSRRVAFPLRSRWKYRRAARFIAVSEFVRSVLMAGGVPGDRITVVYDGVPLLAAHGDAVLAIDKAVGLAAQAARIADVKVEFSSEIERAGVLLYVTASEGLGSGALLAMSAGAAVVASRVGGLTEVIRHGENGLLVENDAHTMAGALRQLRDDPALARRLGEAARQTVAQRFTVEQMVSRTWDVYRQVLR